MIFLIKNMDVFLNWILYLNFISEEEQIRIRLPQIHFEPATPPQKIKRSFPDNATVRTSSEKLFVFLVMIKKKIKSIKPIKCLFKI